MEIVYLDRWNLHMLARLSLIWIRFHRRGVEVDEIINVAQRTRSSVTSIGVQVFEVKLSEYDGI